MTDILRRRKYIEGQVLIETSRILDPQFKSTVVEVSGSQLELLRNLTTYLNRESTFVSGYFDQYYLTPTSDEWDNLLTVVASLEEKLMLVYVDDYVVVRDKKTQNTPGGDFNSGAWRTRDINEELLDASGICSIAGNQITLEPGTYRCSISVPAYNVNRHQGLLYDTTGTATLVLGTSEYVKQADLCTTRSFIVGGFTLSVQSALEVRHRCLNTTAGSGFGLAANFTDEIYTIAEFWRMIG